MKHLWEIDEEAREYPRWKPHRFPAKAPPHEFWRKIVGWDDDGYMVKLPPIKDNQ